MEVPLLSQDEFFRHLNLRSVHATSAKYHYRQALKERLRASSQQFLSLTKDATSNEKIKAEMMTKSPILSPVKWLTPKTRKKMFGQPKIRHEKRVLDFDNNLSVIKEEEHEHNHKLLRSLLTNCHVLRHPGIKKEVESKIIISTNDKFKDEFWEPPSSCIQIRKSYVTKKSPAAVNKKSFRSKRQKKIHAIHIRLQPKLDDPEGKTKKEQKISAALALYHFYKPKSRDGKILSFKEFTHVFVKKSKAASASKIVNDPLESSNWYKHSLMVQIKKLTSNQLKNAAAMRNNQSPPKVQAENNNSSKYTNSSAASANAAEKVDPKIVPAPLLEPPVKTAYGRQIKPVLAPKKADNVKCDHCVMLFSSLTNLKHHMKKAHQLEFQQQKKPADFVAAPKEVKNFPFKCDICYRRFEKRTRMIRHIKSVHSSDIHRVDLNRFVLPRKFLQLHPWSLIEL